MPKRRLDVVLNQRGFTTDKQQAFILVTEGRVFINGQKAISPAQLIIETDRVEVRLPREFVGRGGYKLDAAIDKFGVRVRDKTCVDIGAAVGGFTDVLLKHGAAKVYAIDVGSGRLDLKLREDPRVVVMEGMNVFELGSASHFSSPRGRPFHPPYFKSRSGKVDSPVSSEKRFASPDFAGMIDVVTIDTSFTSLRLILPIVRPWLAEQGRVIALFKPQYEIEDKSLLKHGVVRDQRLRAGLVEAFRSWLGEHGWQEIGFMESPIRGSEGNVEYFCYLAPV